MSLFGILNIGTRGLNASQLAMNVTGQNISNADVEGYSRKRLNLAADYRWDPGYGQMGMGVDVISIDRMRSAFIDEQIRRQKQEAGIFEEYNYSLEGIENILTEPSDTGLLHFIDQFFDGWQNLANNPADISARTMVRTNAEILIDVFHNLSAELLNLRQTRNDEISQRINKINELSEKIFNLNLEIGAIEITGNRKANDSRDKRDELVKELSELIEISIIENERGQVTITTSGSILVSPVDFQKLETFTTTFQMADGTQHTDIGIRFANSKRPYYPTKGQVKGLFDSRDVIIPEYQQRLDELAVALVEKVNELHLQGYTLQGYSGITFFDQDVTGASDITLGPAIRNDVKNIAAASAGESLPAITNSIPAGSHNFGMPPVQLYRDPTAGTPVPARNIVQGTVTVSNGSVLLVEDVDYHIDYINGTIQMLHAGYDADNLTVDFEYRTNAFAGPGDNTNAIAIAKLREQLTMNRDVIGNPTSTFAEYYSSLIGRLGLNRNAAQSNLDTREFLVRQYEQQQDSIAGVSLDEEMANMVKFQHTYQAAAHLISVTDQMLDVLMNM
ncbi:MAG: flagellar hook-associated protein FlgK [Chitinispirillaceae bacterium]|nr:flagellar hook-associated protein FlgK [Chitinispirillaceae bacterium]